jgi:hypothetical protein
MKGVAMARTKKVEKLIEQLIANHLETHLTRMVRKSKKRAEREKAKLKDFLQLPLIKDSEIIEAEYEETPDKNSDSDLKKTGDGEKGQ